MKENVKIGVGIITYNREDFYKKVLNSIPKHRIDRLVIVNDGDNAYVSNADANFVIHNNQQLGVSKTKNKVIKDLIDNGCNHIFILEDDIIIKNDNVFEKYIEVANYTGIHHLCFGDVEIMKDNKHNLKLSCKYNNDISIDLYHNPQGGFMYFNSIILKKFGFFDEHYINAFEHIDIEYNLIKKNLLPPFWYFADIGNSSEYLESIKDSAKKSTITNKEKYEENLRISFEHFIKKWGISTAQIPDIGIEKVKESLKFIKQNYARKS